MCPVVMTLVFRGFKLHSGVKTGIASSSSLTSSSESLSFSFFTRVFEFEEFGGALVTVLEDKELSESDDELSANTMQPDGSTYFLHLERN